jgi:hypothetical protein
LQNFGLFEVWVDDFYIIDFEAFRLVLLANLSIFLPDDIHVRLILFGKKKTFYRFPVLFLIADPTEKNLLCP